MCSWLGKIIMMRFDGHKYVNCRWCRGRGCLQCEAEADAAYKRAFPEGPKPIATFKIDSPSNVEAARRILSPDALASFFGPGGGGLQAFVEAVENAKLPPSEEASDV